MTDELTLVTQEITIDEYGVETVKESETTVLCEVYSITQSEFFAAANTELNPEYRFTVFFGDYNSEEVVIFHGQRYAVYRTYRSGDYMELYVERKIGA
ncbi:MAG: phage head closure protein [Paludibacteraceae bacterium]|nr:phage head closure protein [Paludibacteraceae bacterium]